MDELDGDDVSGSIVGVLAFSLDDCGDDWIKDDPPLFLIVQTPDIQEYGISHYLPYWPHGANYLA